jgi:hypothetical protein
MTFSHTTRVELQIIQAKVLVFCYRKIYIEKLHIVCQFCNISYLKFSATLIISALSMCEISWLFRIMLRTLNCDFVSSTNKHQTLCEIRSTYMAAQSIQCLTTDWKTRRPGFDLRQRQRIFPLTSVSRPALRPSQPPIQWVQRSFPWG